MVYLPGANIYQNFPALGARAGLAVTIVGGVSILKRAAKSSSLVRPSEFPRPSKTHFQRMRTQSTKPTGKEQKFEANEMFFSTTDRKGVITAGNPVFARVSGYSMEEMVGQPHNLIRHADMPRSVFQALWETVKAGNVFLGYVKNHARDGNHYWVFASVIPINDGYLSIRFKPSEAGVHSAEEVYRMMLGVEDEGDRAESQRRALGALEQHVRSASFRNYESFSRAMLAREIKLRDEEIRKRNLALFPKSLAAGTAPFIQELFRKSTGVYEVLTELSSGLETFSGINEKIQEKGQAIIKNADNFRFSAINAHIASDPLGAKGAPLSTVAKFLDAYSRNLSANVVLLAKEIEAVALVLENVTTHISTTRLVLEMSIHYQAEMASSSADHSREDRVFRILKDLTDGFDTLHNATARELQALQSRLPQITGKSDELRKDIISLQVAQLSGMTEAVRIPEAESIRTMMQDFRAEVQQAVQELEHLTEMVQHLQEVTNTTPPKVNRIRRELDEIHGSLTGRT